MKKLIYITAFFLCATKLYAESGMYYAVTSFVCNNDPFKHIFVRGKYKKTQDSMNAPEHIMKAYVHHSARQLLEADNTTIPWNCGEAGAKGHWALYDLNETESKEKLAELIKGCNDQAQNKVCLDKSPWTGYHFPAFDSNVDYRNGDVNNGGGTCHRVRYLRCMTPETRAVDFFFHYTVNPKIFGLKNCVFSNAHTSLGDRYWTDFLPKEFAFAQKIAISRFSDIVDKCKKPVQWSGAPYFPIKQEYKNRLEAIDFIDEQVSKCQSWTQSVECNIGTDHKFTEQDYNL